MDTLRARPDAALRRTDRPDWTGCVRALAMALLAALAPAVAGNADTITDASSAVTVLDRRPGTGERCLVCGKAVRGDEVVELRYRGRRETVAAGMLERFQADPDRYFSRVEARSGLFDERAVAAPAAPGPPAAPLGRWPFWLGLVILAGLITGALTGALAVARGRSPVTWFFAGLGGSLAATAALLSLPRLAAVGAPQGIPQGWRKVATTRAPVPCRACGKPLHPAARRCPSCGAALDPPTPAETART